MTGTANIDTGKGRTRARALQSNASDREVNRAVANTLSTSVQPKLSIGRPNDRYEQEADAIADHIVKGNSEPRAEASTGTANQIHRSSLTNTGTEPSSQAISPNPGKQVNRSPKATTQAPTIQAEFESNEQESIQPKHFAGLQRSGGDDSPTPPPGFAETLSKTRGGGRPLPKSNRSQMESTLGDLGGVRVHTDSPAVQMSESIGARAFTHGNNIYFNQGQYNPDTAAGQHLLAHEATHTVQQGGGVQAKRIQRASNTNSGTGGNATDTTTTPPVPMTKETGVLDEATKTITFSEIGIPAFKLKDHRGVLYNSKKPLKQKANYTRGSTGQRGIWQKNIAKSNTINKLKEVHKTATRQDPTEGESLVFQANIRGRNPKPNYIGTLDTIATTLSTPVWGTDKAFRNYDVDHIVELQLSNWNTATWPNTLENMELLDSSKNRSSGSSIKGAIDAKVSAFHTKHKAQYPDSPAALKTKYTLVFEKAVAKGGGAAAKNQYWTQGQIEKGDHLAPIKAGSMSDLGAEGKPRVYPNEGGGLGKTFRWIPGKANVLASEKGWFGSPFQIVAKNFNTEGDNVETTPTLGSLQIQIDPASSEWKQWDAPKQIEIKRYPGAKYAGYITKQAIKSTLYGLRVKKMSPVEILEVGMGENGITAYGHILPDIPLFKDSPVEFRIANGALEVSKTFTIDQIKVPPPFTVTNSSLTVFANTKTGLGLEGATDFGINQVGEGSLRAKIATGENLELEGEFNFDSKLFDPAKISASYKDNKFTVGGEIGIPAGKVKGIKSATITASYTEGGPFEASGTAQLDIPGVEQGNMNVTIGPDIFQVGGSFQLNKDVPGIDSGSVEAQLTKDEAGEWHVKASGTAKPSIPGIDTTVNVTYDDGIFDINAHAGYERGMLGGTIHFGVTNRAAGEDGEPTGDPSQNLIVYGGGSLSLTLAPWLKATAGVTFLPNGEIEVVGEIGIPDKVELIKRKPFDKNLFKVKTQIPLFAIPLGPVSLGLVAFIEGGGDFTAGIGPGTLEQLKLGIKYNPDREDETTITGKGQFVLPADAGLEIYLKGGIGLSVVIASVQGFIKLRAKAGIEGGLNMEVDVNWNPQEGLAIDTLAEVLFRPALTLGADIGLEASVGIWPLEYTATWDTPIAEKTWGSDFEFGLRFPMHYKEGEPFNLSMNDLELVYPEFDTTKMVEDVAEEGID